MSEAVRRRVCRLCHPECEYVWPYCHYALEAEYEREYQRWDLEQDITHEAELARAHARDDLDCPWPWYADEPVEIEEPEVFGP